MRLALALLCSLLLAASRAGAQDRAIRITDFDAVVAVSPDGSLDVTERISLRFDGQWNGILRNLSRQHRTAEGRPRLLDIDVQSVTDAEGQRLRMEEEDDGDSGIESLRIYVPGARDAVRQVVLRYRVEGAMRFFFADSVVGDLDEVYWNVTGNEWDMPIDRARVRVVLPPGVRPTRAAAYTGVEGSTYSDADVQTVADGIIVTTTRALGPYEGLTVAAGWPPGAIAGRPSERVHRVSETVRYWPVALPFLVFALAFRSWRRRGRDPQSETVVVQYEPPDGLSPAEVGTLVDHRAEMRDITATLVDLAVRGFVRIEEHTERRLLGLVKDTDFVFFLRRPREQWSGLATHEERYLDGLFRHASVAPWSAVGGDGDDWRSGTGDEPSIRLSDLTNRFHKELPGIKDAIYESLVRRGFYKVRPDRMKLFWFLGAGALLTVGLMASGFASGPGATWISATAMGSATVLCALILFIFGWIMPARTAAGARARERALGFREFLSRVESDRFKRMITSPEMFERFLPHAMAFGEEKRWARAFEDIVKEPPGWYVGTPGTHFHASHFSSRMSTLSTTASSTMSSSPSSSGSGGGGSSGGGSGGGGGSGF